MVELEEQWIREILSPKMMMILGLSLIIIGGILLTVGKKVVGGDAVSVREDLIIQADIEWDNRKKHHLGEEIKSIKSLPRMGKGLIIIGGFAISIAVLMLIPG